MKKLSGFIIAVMVFLSFSAFCETEYLIKLSGDTAIYLGPGERYDFNRYVGEDGVYTIVDKRIGEDGFLWGRLKSGAGWVRLSDAPEDMYGHSETPFTVKLPQWVPIFDGAGFDAIYRKNVGKDGVYTIVETIFDDENNLWGRLKSGAGWVNLTRTEYQKCFLPRLLLQMMLFYMKANIYSAGRIPRSIPIKSLCFPKMKLRMCVFPRFSWETRSGRRIGFCMKTLL